MNKTIQYSDEPVGDIELVADFLPSPDELALKNQNTKVTISLSSESVAYFKDAAKKHHMQYQKMIRQLLDEYVQHQKTTHPPPRISKRPPPPTRRPHTPTPGHPDVSVMQILVTYVTNAYQLIKVVEIIMLFRLIATLIAIPDVGIEYGAIYFCHAACRQLSASGTKKAAANSTADGRSKISRVSGDSASHSLATVSLARNIISIHSDAEQAVSDAAAPQLIPNQASRVPPLKLVPFCSI